MNRKVQGFSLIEVTMAIGITAFCLIAIFGLLPVGLGANQSAYEQTIALNIASALISDAASIPAGEMESKTFAIALPPEGSTTQQSFRIGDSGEPVATATDARYLAIVTLTSPPSTRSRQPMQMHVMVTWPSAANSGIPASGENLRGQIKNTSGSVETVASLNRT